MFLHKKKKLQNVSKSRALPISFIEMHCSEFIPVHVFSISNHPEQDQDIITETSNVSSYTKTPLVMASWPIR